jgi:transposase
LNKLKRHDWQIKQPEMDFNRLVFFDESSINTGMTRFYGRAKKGDRVVEHIPDIRFERTTILSSVRANCEIVPMLFSGSLNGEIFKKYISDFLVPTLKKDDIVVLDNLSSHKVKGVEESIKKVGAKILFLPPYSPDFNPIELMWSKIKSYFLKVKARSKELLEIAISEAINRVTKSDILGWFRKNGYNTQ